MPQINEEICPMLSFLLLCRHFEVAICRRRCDRGLASLQGLVDRHLLDLVAAEDAEEDGAEKEGEDTAHLTNIMNHLQLQGE